MFVENFADAYKKLRARLIDAEEVAPRGLKSKELLNVPVTFVDPLSRLAYHAERKYNLPFNIAETVLMLNGENSVQKIQFFNKKVADYSDDGETFYGAYGPRFAPFIPKLIAKLKSDNDSRQAVINIFNSRDSYDVVTKDVPCTIAMHFMIRNNKLNATTYMRSNDFFWGFQYDVFMFTMVQECVANELGIDMGTYTHVDTSLHVYEHHFDMLKNIEEMKPVVMPRSNLKLNEYAMLNKFITEMVNCILPNSVIKMKSDLFGIHLVEPLFNHFMKRKLLRPDEFVVDKWAKIFTNC